MKKGLAISVILIMIFGFALSLNAEDRVVEAEGISALSKKDAIREAQRAAVEQAVGVLIQSQTVIEDFEVKKDKIMSRTQGYVTRFTIIKETRIMDIFNVKINAVISLDKIQDDLVALGLLMDSMDRPKLMVLIEEKYIGMDDLGMRLAETEISSLFAAKKFDLVDQAQLEQIKSMDKARQALRGNMAAAQSLGLNFGAQYVILGKAVVQDIGEAFPGTGMKSLQASMQLKVLQTQSGLALGSVVKNGVAAHISPLTGATKALRISAQKAVDDLLNTITMSWQDFLNNGAPLKLHFTGIKTFRQYKKVASAVDTLERVVSSKKEGWNKAGGLLILDLRFKGNSEELAEMLDGMDLSGNQLEVVDFAPDRVDCSFN